jgi:AcrR family transcriptional regulator
MSPRKYDMSRRAAATEATRRRIIDATRELHSAQGVAATSWDDIARRAGVGVGTVYRHFPTLDELIPACGEVSMGIVALPDPADAPALFEGVRRGRARLERLVAEAYAIYERGADVLGPVRRERGLHPALDEAGRTLEVSLDALIDAALEPFAPVDAADRRVVRAMLDLATWQALREQGFEGDDTVQVVAGMLAARLRPAAIK